jgi:hypothetical protein
MLMLIKNKKTNYIYMAILLLSSFLLISYLISSTANADTTPADPAAGSTIDQRIEQRKRERNLAYDEKETNRLTSRCVQGQNNLRRLVDPKTRMLERRDQAYANVSAKTWIAVGSIRLAKIDTFNLERLRLKFDEELVEYRKLSNNYKLALEDSIQMNCGSDIIGFMSVLETLRIYDQQLANLARKMRQTASVQLREELNAANRELQPRSVEED